MTLLISAKCNDGILLTADSAAQDGVTGEWSATGVKWFVGECDQVFHVVVFGGEAYITDEQSTLEVLSRACRLSDQHMCVHMAEAIKNEMEHEYQEGIFVSDAARQDYGQSSVLAYLATGADGLFRLALNRHGALPFVKAVGLDMDIFDLPGDQAVRNELLAMKSPRATVIQAADHIGSMFEFACAHLESAKFPGVGIWVRAGGVKVVKFNSRAEFVVGLQTA